MSCTMYFIPYDLRSMEDGSVLVGRICVEPQGQARCSILKPCGGDIPRLTSGQAVQELMVFSAGVSFGWKSEVRSSLRVRGNKS